MFVITEYKKKYLRYLTGTCYWRHVAYEEIEITKWQYISFRSLLLRRSHAYNFMKPVDRLKHLLTYNNSFTADVSLFSIKGKAKHGHSPWWLTSYIPQVLY